LGGKPENRKPAFPAYEIILVLSPGDEAKSRLLWHSEEDVWHPREGSFTLRIFVPGGDFEGLRIVEKSNWNGRGLVCPRSTFPKAKVRPEFSRTGVYVLTGPEEEGGQLKVYIGEGDPNGPRLEQHYAKKDFWTTCSFLQVKTNI